MAPENTLEAFRVARDLGADGVELDARRTADGVIIVHHDPQLPGDDRPIVAMERSELLRLAPAVPDLVDALAACEGLEVDVEIKNAPFEPDWDPDDRVLQTVLPMLGDDHLISSFNIDTVRRAHAAGVRTGWLLIRQMDPIAVLAEWPGYELILPSVEKVPGTQLERVVTAARAAAARVGVWTVDDPAEVKRLADGGVDIVFTNDPRLGLEVVKA